MIQPSMTFKGTVHFVDGNFILASTSNDVYCSDDGGSKWTLLLRFPLKLYDMLKCSLRLPRRLFRSGIHHAIKIDKSTVVFWAFGTIYRYDIASRTLQASSLVYSGSRPLSLCFAGKDTLFFGEYRNNSERSPVHIYGSNDGGMTWHTVWVFSSIRHVHGVYHDPYTDHIWITTGDEDHESGIWVTKDYFNTVERVVTGTQQTRAIQLLFNEDFVYFGSDTPKERNWIYRLNRLTRVVDQIQEVDGSIFYGCSVGSNMFFSTVCEPSIVNKSRTATVWTSRDGIAWRPFLEFRKDIYPMKLFQYGQVIFPFSSRVNNAIWLTPFATEYDQVSMKFFLQGTHDGK